MVFQLDNDLSFPDPHLGDADGLLAIGGDLSIDRLLLRLPHAADRHKKSGLHSRRLGNAAL